MTKTPPEIDKYGTHKKWCLTKMAHRTKKCPNHKAYLLMAELSDFRKGILKYVVWFRHMVMGFSSRYFSTLEWYSYYSPVYVCRGSISRVLVVLQKTNNVVVRWWGTFYVGCFFCEVVFLIRGEPFL